MELDTVRNLYQLLNDYKTVNPDEPFIHEAWLQVASKLDDIDPDFH